MMTYLAGGIRIKGDRAAKSVSLETCVPKLKHWIVFAWRLAISLKERGSTSKWLLRDALYRRVPRELNQRPKMDFGIPLGHAPRVAAHRLVRAIASARTPTRLRLAYGTGSPRLARTLRTVQGPLRCANVLSYMA
jgi:asparagine synthetase B (glutamine-hydrolysing)